MWFRLIDKYQKAGLFYRHLPQSKQIIRIWGSQVVGGRGGVEGLAVPEISQVHTSLILKIQAVLNESWNAWFLKKKALGSSEAMHTTHSWDLSPK